MSDNGCELCFGRNLNKHKRDPMKYPTKLMTTIPFLFVFLQIFHVKKKNTTECERNNFFSTTESDESKNND